MRPRSVDRYGRVVAVVILPDGRALDDVLVAAGLAWWFRRYAAKNARLAAIEQEARDARHALWADPKPVPPWLWRRAARRPAASDNIR